jgi:ribosomal protein S18 acetylase RimI-like enzyme
VVTARAVRGRGVGTALTVAALRTIGAHGLDTAVLTSSPDGLRIYQRLGFQVVGRVRRYLWSPTAAGNAAMITRPDGTRNIAVPANDVAERGGYPAQAWVQRPAMPS